MRRASVFMPFFALLVGVFGFYLRLMELRNIFDSITGLPERNAVITNSLILLTAIFLIIVFIFVLNVINKFTSQRGFEKAFGTEPLAYPTIFFLIGIIWLGATVKHFIDVNETGDFPISEFIFSILSVFSAISVSFFAIDLYQDPRRTSKLALSIVPTIFMCFWLIIFYRENASNPILLRYCYECLAIVTSALAFYFTSGFVYNRPAPGKTIFMFMAAIYFCSVTLADEHAASIKLIFGVMIAINIVYSSMLIRNMRRK